MCVIREQPSVSREPSFGETPEIVVLRQAYSHQTAGHRPGPAPVLKRH